MSTKGYMRVSKVYHRVCVIKGCVFGTVFNETERV